MNVSTSVEPSYVVVLLMTLTVIGGSVLRLRLVAFRSDERISAFGGTADSVAFETIGRDDANI